MITTVKEMYYDKIKGKLQRPSFEYLLSDYYFNSKCNNMFPIKILEEVIDSISSEHNKIRILGSEKTKEIKNNNPSIIILVKENPQIPIGVLIDVLYKQKEMYEIVGEHICCKSNYLTRVSQLIISDFLCSLGSSCSEVCDYLKCIEYNVKEKLYPEENIRESLSLIIEELFSLLNELDLNYNLVYVIQNAEYLDEDFIKFIKRYKTRFPKYVKLVLTMNKSRKASNSISTLSGSLKIPITTGNFILSFLKYTCNRIIEDADEKLYQTLLLFIGDDLKKLKNILLNFLSKYKGTKLKRVKALEILTNPELYSSDLKIDRIKNVKLETNGIMEQVILFLIEAKSPIPVNMLQSWLNGKETLIKELSAFSNILMFNEDSITPETIVKLKYKRLWKKLLKEKIDATINKTVNVITECCWNILENKAISDIPIYYHFNTVYHYSKIQKDKRDNEFITTRWLFAQIEAFKNFDRVFADLDKMLYLAFDNGLNTLKNNMYILENIYMGKKLAATEFVTQLQSRLRSEVYPSLQFINENINSVKAPYFNPIHSALKENSNLEHVLETDSPITAAFLTDDYLVYATEGNLLYIHTLTTYELVFQYSIEFGVYTLCYAKEGKFLLGGDMNVVCVWTIDGPAEENPIQQLSVHAKYVKKIIYFDDIFYLIAGDTTLCKCGMKPLEVEKETKIMQDTIITLEVTKAKNGPFNYDSILVLVGLSLGSIFVFDSKLKDVIKVIDTEKTIVSLHALPKFDDSFINVSSDGDITIYSNTTITPIRSFSIFRVEQEELKEVFVEKEVPRMFSVESNMIRIYNWETHALIDEWLYMFKSKICFTAKSPNDKFLLTADTGSRLCLFNIQKELRQRHALKIPAHKRKEQIAFILSTPETPESRSYLITCSIEREIKMWVRDTCEFIKEFNLSSIVSNFIRHNR